MESPTPPAPRIGVQPQRGAQLITPRRCGAVGRWQACTNQRVRTPRPHCACVPLSERQPAIRDRPSAAEPCGHEAETPGRAPRGAVSGGTGAGLLRSTRRRLDLSTVVFPQLKD